MGKKRRTTKARGAQRAPQIATAAPTAWRGLTPWHGELAGVLCLIALAIYFIAISWRKWPDPLVDFGRELYIPWRIANGEVLYRELGGHFGPLAQYFDGLLFKICGPGLMVLVTANLVIFAIILLTFYLLAPPPWRA